MTENNSGKDKQAAGHGLTRDRFNEVVEQIEKSGGTVSYEAIAGITGASKTTFGPWLRELKRSRQGVDPMANYNDALIRGLKAHAEAACAELKNVYDHHLAEADEYAKSLESDLRNKDRITVELQVSLETVRQERDTFAGRIEQLDGDRRTDREALTDKDRAIATANDELISVRRERDQCAGQRDRLEKDLQTAAKETTAEREARHAAERKVAELSGERDALYRHLQGIENQLAAANKRVDDANAIARAADNRRSAVEAHLEHALNPMPTWGGASGATAERTRPSNVGEPATIDVHASEAMRR